jgi:hypothetical protein
LDESFKISLRGYDRDQVDARIKELKDELSRARLGNVRNNQELDAMRAEISSLNDQLTRTGKSMPPPLLPRPIEFRVPPSEPREKPRQSSKKHSQKPPSSSLRQRPRLPPSWPPPKKLPKRPSLC